MVFDQLAVIHNDLSCDGGDA